MREVKKMQDPKTENFQNEQRTAQQNVFNIAKRESFKTAREKTPDVQKKVFTFKNVNDSLRAVSNNTKTKVYYKLVRDTETPHKCYICEQKQSNCFIALTNFTYISFCQNCIAKNRE